MGGNLFKLPRMPKADYLEREREIKAYCETKLGAGWRIPRYLGDKIDFGDMDVLIAARDDWHALRDEITRELGISQTRAVGHVYSTVFKGLQADFFTVPERYLDSTANFMAFNDLGNLLGRICRRFDLKYGEHGLSYVYRRERGNYQTDLEISTDMRVICDFLGLEYAVWEAGFTNRIAMFEWVITSPYFSSKPYEGELEGSLKDRTHRTIIEAFIAFLHERQIQRHPVFLERSEYLPMLLERFPILNEQLEREQQLEHRAEAFTAKFSGQLVMRLRPELHGEALGKFIQALKASLPDFEAFVLDSSDEAIQAFILQFER
jgi:hypothetical protein